MLSLLKKFFAPEPNRRLYFLLGICGACVLGSIIPPLHFEEFLIDLIAFGDFRFRVWQYEFVAHMAAIFIFLFICLFRSPSTALWFLLGFAISYSPFISLRANAFHQPISMLVASFIVFSLVVALCILVMKFFSYFSSFVPTRKQWNSWTLPSKYSWVGFLGVFFSIFAWAVVPSDFLIFSMKPPLEETAFVHYGNVVSIRFEGGRTKSESIQILGARTHATAVFAEYYWLRKHFPRHAMVLQRIDRYSDPRYKKEKLQVVNGEEREMKSDQPSVGDRVLDAITIINWLRVKQTYFFDVTECMRMGETDPRQIRSSGQINK